MPKEIITSAVEALSAQDGAKVVGLIKDVNDQGYNLVQLAHDLRDHLRRVLMYKINPAVLDIVSDDKALLESQKALFTVPWLLRAGNLLSKALDEMRWSDDPRLILELYLLRLSQPYASINELLERMETLSKEVPSVEYSTSVQAVKPSQPQSQPQPVRPAQVRETPVETFADTEPEPAAIPEPAASGDNAELWRRAVVVLRKDMPLTGNLLSTARYKSLEGSTLTVAVRTKFEQEGVKRKKEDIEAVLKTAFNAPVNLNVIVDDSASAAPAAPRQETIITDEENVVESANRVYKVVEEPAGAQPLPLGLEKVLNKFPGKVKKKE